MIEVLSWYGLSWLLGLLALPLCFALFPRLPDRGYSFSRPLGLLLVSLLAWWLGNLQVFPFTQFWLWVVVVAFGVAVNLLLLLNGRLSRELAHWLGQRHTWKLIGVSELVFLAAYTFVLNARSFLPQLDHDEKFFDLAFLQSLVTSPSLPAPDPWWGGEPMYYYYGGQLLVAVMCKLSGVEAAVGYNLGLGLFYGVTALACFGLTANLAGLADSKHKGRAKISVGLLGTLFMAVLGNLMPLRQLLDGKFLPPGDRNFPLYVDWWSSGRMIWDYLPKGRRSLILSETPIYTYLLGDLHAHVMALPYALLAIAGGLHLFTASGKWVLVRSWREWPGLGLLAIVLGSLSFINGLDFPIYLVLIGIVLWLVEWRGGDGWLRAVGRSGTQMVLVVLLAGITYFFYFVQLSGKPRTAKLPEELNTWTILSYLSRYLDFVNWPRTNLSEYLTMFGLLLLPILTFYALMIGQLWRQERLETVLPLPDWLNLTLKLVGIVLLIIGVSGLLLAWVERELGLATFKSLTMPLMTLPVAGWLLWPGAWAALRQRPRLAIEGLTGLTLLGYGPFYRFELLGPLVILLYFSVRFLVSLEAGWQADKFAWLAVALASALIGVCELIYIRDYMQTRAFMTWKWWYQAWALYGLAATYFAWRILTPAHALTVQPTTRRRWRAFAFSRAPWWPQQASSLVLAGPYNWLARTQLSSAQPTATLPSARPNKEVEKAAPALPKRRWGWRRTWVWLLVFLMLMGAATPGLAYWQHSDYYKERKGLDGEAWLAKEFPADYQAIRWLREYTGNRAERRGLVLEANGLNYTWANRVSTYTGLPTVVGWPFHELHWRSYLDPLDIWKPWVEMGQIYETTDARKAEDWLKEHKVRYVFVGQVERGERGFFPDSEKDLKKYSAEALAKFTTFMTPIYIDAENNVIIYAFE